MTLSIKECLRFGWDAFKKRPWLLVGALAIGIAVEGMISVLEELGEGPFSFFMLLIALALSMLYSLGHTHLFLKAHDRPEEARFKDLWHPKPFWHFLATAIALWLIIGLPYLALALLQVPPIVLILLAIPALVVSLVFGFAFYLVVDKGLSALAALKESARITRGHRFQLFLLLLAVIGINIVGLAALLVGLFVTIPVTVLAMVHAYRTLSGTLASAPAEALETPEEEG